MVRAYGLTYDVPITITNCSNNYGPFQFPEKVIPLFTTRALAGEPLPLYASTKNRREWLHVDDHAAAIDAVVHHGRVGETYNVGSGHEVDVEGIADAVLDARWASGRSSRRSSPTGPATTAATCSTPPSCARSWGGRRGSGGTRASRRPSTGTARNEAWWRPLLGRAPVVEGAGADWGRA